MALVSDSSPEFTRPDVGVSPPKIWKSRNLSLDRARTFLTILVLIHHAVIPYTHFGHTDGASWFGFDCVVLATDSFFMAMFFFLSGLFLWPSVGRRQAGRVRPRPADPARHPVRGRRGHHHPDRLLRDRAAPDAGLGLQRILVEDRHRRARGRAARCGFSGCC